MCKAPKPPKPTEPKKPQFLRNRYLDEYVGDAQAVNSLRTGRDQLRIPLGGPAPIGGRQPGAALPQPTNTRRPPANPPPDTDADFRRSMQLQIRDRLLKRT